MKKTPFYPLMVQEGAKINETAWNTAAVYTNVAEEHYAVRNAVGATDWSTMCKFDIKGPDAKEFIQYMVVNDVNKLYPGRVMYCCMATEDGGMYDDTTVYCFADDHYLLVGSTAGRAKDIKRFATYSVGRQVYITDITAAYGLLALQGPNSRDLLNQVCADSLTDLAYYHFFSTSIDGRPVMISRTGFTGELGYEVYIPAEDCMDIWEVIASVGSKFGLKLVGLSAASGIIRLEKGLIGGADYGEDINPYEVGLGWTVALNTDFIGRDALLKIHDEGPSRKLMGFQSDEKDKIAKKGAIVMDGDREIGHVTSGNYSYTFNKSIGLALIDADVAVVGKSVKITIGEEIISATLYGKNMYDPDGRRLKS